MPSHKKTQIIVVRPISRETGAPTKTVLGTLNQLNQHAKADHFLGRESHEGPKPWKQSSKVDRHRHDPITRLNAGRNDGASWVTRQQVCGRNELEMEMELELEIEELETDHVEPSEERARAPERVEVSIMDIAKPPKRRGPAKKFEMIETVPKVIVLDDDGSEWGWEISSEELDLLDWEDIQVEFVEGCSSYAQMAGRTPG